MDQDMTTYPFREALMRIALLHKQRKTSHARLVGRLYLRSNGDKTMTQYTEKEVQRRFEMAEKFAGDLYRTLMEECPQEVEDHFRMGEDKEHFGVLLIAPGMQLEEGVYCVGSSLETDVDLNLAPHDLVLERGLDFKYRVRLRTQVPEAENLIPPDSHMFPEPGSWQEVVDWVQALKSMGCVHGWE